MPNSVTSVTVAPDRFHSGRPASRAAWQVVLRGAVFLSLLLFCGGLSAAEKAKNVSEILEVEREVEISRAGSTVWEPARPGQLLQVGDRLKSGKSSRALIRLADKSVIRVNEQTTLQLLSPSDPAKKSLLDLKSGSLYFFSREKPQDIQFRTPLAAGAIRGTEFILSAAESGLTVLTLLDGAVDLSNAFGAVTLASGEEATVEAGKAPVKAPVINALNKIQWALYYPAVLDPSEPGLAENSAESLQLYRAGNLRQALQAAPDSSGAVYRAALQLSVGQVSEAESLLASSAPSELAEALRELIRAVQFQTNAPLSDPSSASGWLARSYTLQSRSDLPGALRAAKSAAEKSPSFGFAWARVAELEFSFGRIAAAAAALDQAEKLSPEYPPIFALRGFLSSAQRRFPEALEQFDRAIALDGSFGNAWLGRGLVRIAQGDAEEGRRDLQSAAALEPQRSILRSYLAKSYFNSGEAALAEKDLRMARQLDPNDPTAWLYSALINQQRNRINEAVRDLETSQDLNDNRSVFRSRLLLDQDKAVRAANLASVYEDAGMSQVSAREAARAVNYDHANYSAHLFLAHSYEPLTDLKDFSLRYETAKESELLTAHLLAPVGAGNISRNLAAQDYTRLFEGKKAGLNAYGEYRSHGEWLQESSIYGTIGGSSYAIDTIYHTDPGYRSNNDLERLEASIQFKQQLTLKDSVYFQVGAMDLETGDLAQRYNAAAGSPTYRMEERQDPYALAGYHREWAPGSHSLVLFGRLEDSQKISDPVSQQLFFRQIGGAVTSVSVAPLIGLESRRELETYFGEFQHIRQTESHSIIAGTRYQGGSSDASAHVTRPPASELVNNDVESDLKHFSAYGYYQWQIFSPLRLTAGASYDHVDFPLNYGNAPWVSGQQTEDQVSPKIGLYYNPWTNGVFRAAYTRSLGGLIYGNSLRLEPTQVAGFNQAYRSLIPESAAGLVLGTHAETFSAGFDQSFKTGTYLGIEAQMLRSESDRLFGVLTNSGFIPAPSRVSSSWQALDFEEKSLLFNVNQLLGSEWAAGAQYRITEAEFESSFPAVASGIPGANVVNEDVTAVLHHLALSLIYNHHSGVFSQFQSAWVSQSNQGYAADLPGEDFWQHHFFVGYRFPRRHAEIRLGVLNLTDRDYQLNPLTYYTEHPRERTLTAAVKVSF